MEIPEYKNLVLDKLNSFLVCARPYCGSDSPLTSANAAALTQRLGKAENICHEQINNFRPKIMLYGVYNSGKSTLLNALLGEERAETGDIPKTCKATAYDWLGHEVIDTPGIDAPIEHTAISHEAMRACQIIAFVVSAKGSFENREIYEAMREVIDQGKRLIIILNNKDSEYEGDELAEIKDRIQKILEQQGFSREQAASFRLTPVNAQCGLEGKLNNDEKLIAYSGIRDVEQLFYDELLAVKGYAIIKDVFSYLLADYKYFLNILEETLKKNDERQNQAFFDLREQYHNFRTVINEYVDTECANLSGEIFNCFPANNADFSEDRVKEAINAVLQSYMNAVNSRFKQECESFGDMLLRQGAKILQSGEESLHMEIGLENYEELIANLTQLSRETKSGSGPNFNDDDFMDKLGEAAGMLSTVPLLKLPLPVPIPPVVITAVLLGIRAITAIFGKSRSQKENERLEAQIRYEREMAEKQARAQERQREEIALYSKQIKDKFVRDLKPELQTEIEKRFKPILDALEEQCNANNALDVKIRNDISMIFENIHDIENRIAELA